MELLTGAKLDHQKAFPLL